MRRLNLAALIGAVVLGGIAAGCGGEVEEVPEGEQIVFALPEVELRPILEAMDSEESSRLVATLRGPGQIGYLQPDAQRQGDEIVTEFLIKNVSTGALAGFKIDEFWYDGAGDAVTGSSYRMRRPLRKDEVVQITLHTPRSPNATRSNWEFSHQNGVIEANLFEEMEDPTLIIEGDEVTEVEPEAEEAGDEAQ